MADIFTTILGGLAALAALGAASAKPVDDYQPQFHPGPAKNWVSGQVVTYIERGT